MEGITRRKWTDSVRTVSWRLVPIGWHSHGVHQTPAARDRIVHTYQRSYGIGASFSETEIEGWDLIGVATEKFIGSIGA